MRGALSLGPELLLYAIKRGGHGGLLRHRVGFTLRRRQRERKK
jgi:hypothetical protein